ncbi:MAG TPA: ABC transporter permease [Gemmatimonadaceae bacterium]
MIKTIRMRLRALFNRAAVEADLREELRFHIEQQTRQYIQQGMRPEDAARRARLAFGSVDASSEGHRDHRGTRTLEEILGDVRYAARALWRDRALALAGVATLALGIGATTAVFSAVNEVMLRQLPFADAERLVQVWEQNPDRGWYKNWVAPANYLDWRSRVSAFQDAAAYFDFVAMATLLGHGEPQLVPATSVTGNFTSVLGIRPVLGRGFSPEDDFDHGGTPQALISSRLWRRVFRSDTGIIGTSMSLSGRPIQIIGVLPDGFILPTPNVDIFTPMYWSRTQPATVNFRRAHSLRVVARLKPGVSIEGADASLQVVVKQLEAEYPVTNTRMGAGITPLREWIVGDTKRPLIVLLSAATVLLLIACANVGNLLLVHALGRSRDVALRFVLGATRARVAQQALTESLVLSVAGGVSGSVLGWVGAKALLSIQPKGMLPVTGISLDYRVLAFTTLLVALSTVVFGVAPALIATRQSPANALSGSSRSVTGGRARRWARQLVVAEVALAVVLMVGAGLLLRSYKRLTKVDPGFDATGVLATTLAVPGTRYDSSYKVSAFFTELMSRVRALPGVESVGASRELPVTQTSWSANLAISGQPPFEKNVDILYREVMGDYFKVMRVPLLKGRSFSDADVVSTLPVAIINETVARQFFADLDPVGMRITTNRIPDSTATWYTVVGVVGSERQSSLALPARPEVYLNGVQNPTRRMSLVVRMAAGLDPAALSPSVRRTVRGMDSLLAITSITPMTEVLSAASSRQRFTSVLVLSFAITGVVLALVGVFGVLAQLVQTRWREMGIRMALGAQRSDVRWMVVRNGAALIAGGVTVGLIISLGATRVLATLLYDTAPNDALTYALVTGLIVSVGLIAALVPAWRASSASPANTLRAE